MSATCTRCVCGGYRHADTLNTFTLVCVGSSSYCEGLHRRCVEAITAAYTLTALNSMAHVESLAMMSELYDAVVEAQRFISEV